MATMIPGQLYLADQRELTQTERFQRLTTLDFTTYGDAHDGPAGRLLAVHEERLAGGQRSELPVRAPGYLLLLPITGAVQVQGPQGETHTVEVEHVRVLALPAAGVLTFSNPYPDDVVHFLHLWLGAGPARPVDGASFAFTAGELANRLACLVPAAAGLPFTVCLGRFAGRREAVYRAAHAQALVFSFVLAGAFEVEGRLLHAQDGLALWDAPTVEYEALSEEALVLVLEAGR